MVSEKQKQNLNVVIVPHLACPSLDVLRTSRFLFADILIPQFCFLQLERLKPKVRKFLKQVKDDDVYTSLGQLAVSLTKEDIAKIPQKAFRYSGSFVCFIRDKDSKLVRGTFLGFIERLMGG